MLPIQSMVPTLLLVAGAAVLADPGAPLAVLRFTPQEDAAPTASVTVTFDRPVAGSLDRSVDPGPIFRIEPAVQGTVEWRDPVTIRFRPAAPLPSGRSFTVTIGDGFEAMDGSRLERPFRFTFQVRGPRVLAGTPVSAGQRARFVRPDQRFDLVVDAPVDTGAVARS
ncbi:MAG TPA: Ig-like domain-containing protein, partial [Phycisphaerales bacterium]|nr:Ig-like domain-containing protein [Phycisphaerales bacterium]